MFTACPTHSSHVSVLKTGTHTHAHVHPLTTHHTAHRAHRDPHTHARTRTHCQHMTQHAGHSTDPTRAHAHTQNTRHSTRDTAHTLFAPHFIRAIIWLETSASFVRAPWNTRQPFGVNAVHQGKLGAILRPESLHSKERPFQAGYKRLRQPFGVNAVHQGKLGAILRPESLHGKERPFPAGFPCWRPFPAAFACWRPCRV